MSKIKSDLLRRVLSAQDLGEKTIDELCNAMAAKAPIPTDIDALSVWIYSIIEDVNDKSSIEEMEEDILNSLAYAKDELTKSINALS